MRRGRARERGLPHVEWVAPQVITVQLEQVEGVEEDACVMLAITDAVEVRDAVLAAGKRLAVDDARACAQASEGLRRTRSAILASDDSEARLISCSHSGPEGGCWAAVGRHGAMKPAKR